MPPREFAGYKAIRNHMTDFPSNVDLKVDFLELQVISDGNIGTDYRPYSWCWRSAILLASPQMRKVG